MNELDLFAAAIAIADPEERAAVLDRECAGRPDLRSRIEQLLDAHFRSQPLLDQPELVVTGAHHTRGPATAAFLAAEAVGTVVAGRYKLLEEIGEGGMGTVWVAEQTAPVKRKVALKLIKAGMDSKSVLARFEAERQALALMDHPNIAKILDGGLTQAGRPFFVMDYVKGVPITEYCDATRLSVPQRLELFMQVCQAVQHAHQKGIIHRDLKPSNILVAPYDDKPVPKIIDFGLAKAMHQSLTERTLHTAHESVLGTPLYMSPEQAQLNNLDVDTRSDIYSLGVLLYELLTGTTPLEKKRFKKAAWDEVRRIIREEEPPRPSTRLSSIETLPSLAAGRQTEPARLTKLVRGDLDWITMKALEKDRTRRYETANSLARDVERYLADEAVEACPPSASYRLRKFARKYRTVLTTAAAFVVLLTAGAAIATWQAVRATRAEGDALAAADAEKRAKEDAQAAQRGEAAQRAIAVEQAGLATEEARISRRLLYAADMHLAKQAWEAGDTGHALAVLHRQWNQAVRTESLGFEWRQLWLACQDRSRQTLRGHTGRINSVAFSRNGEILVTGGNDHSVRVWDGALSRHYRLVGPRIFSVAVSPIGDALGLIEQHSKTVRLWDLANRRERASFIHNSSVSCGAFSPDGKLLATGCEDGTVWIWHLTAPQDPSIHRGHNEPIRCVAFAPDNKTLASGGGDTTVRLWDVAGGRELTQFVGHGAFVLSLSFSADGRVLASGNSDSTVRLWDIATKKLLKKLGGQQTAVVAVTFAPDGRALATGGGDGTIRVWDTESNEVAAMLRGHTGVVTALAYAPDGQSLVSGCGDGTVKVWDVARPDLNILTGHKIWFSSVACSPDSRTVAVGDYQGGQLTLWDMASRRQITITSPSKSPVRCVTFAPDGQTLAGGCDDNKLRLWDVATKKQKAEFQHKGPIQQVAFSPDGAVVAAGGYKVDTVRVWNCATGMQLAEFTPGNAVQFSPDGKLLAASCGDTVQFWEVAKWKPLPTPLKHPTVVACFAFAPDGQTLATGDWDGNLRLWDVVRRREVVSRKVHTAVIASLAFSPQTAKPGRLATAGGDSIVRLWDVALLQEVAALAGHDGATDRATRERLWAAASVATLAGHEGPIPSMAFSPDGNLLATGGNDATVRLWVAPPSPAALPESAQPASIPPPTETVRLFSLELTGAAQATMVAEEKNIHRMDVTAVDETDWHAKLLQVFDDLQEGVTYTVRFRAKADAPRRVRLLGQITEPPWSFTGLDRDVLLTKHWREYRYEFQAKGLTPWNRVLFVLGQQTGSVWIADFTVTKSTIPR